MLYLYAVQNVYWIRLNKMNKRNQIKCTSFEMFEEEAYFRISKFLVHIDY